MGCLSRAPIVCNMDDNSLSLSKKSVDPPPSPLFFAGGGGGGGGGEGEIL